MYEISLTKFVNLRIADLNCEFTPSRNKVVLTDEQYAQSNDIKKYIDKYFSVKKIEGEMANTNNVTAKPAKDIVEIPVVEPKTEEDEMANVVNATGASKTNSGEQAKETKTLEEEANVVDETIVDATDASKTTSATNTANVVVEEVKVEKTVPVEETAPAEKVVETKADNSDSKKTSKKAPKTKKK